MGPVQCAYGIIMAKDCTVMSCFTGLAGIYIIIVTITGLDLKVQLVAPNNYKLYTYPPVCKHIHLGPGRGDVHCYDVEVYSTIDIIVVYSHVP